jgi:UDP-GlcNAc:undecaprenyl-phosphate/decaprenyl-phosphate GlcNAc-1-phosphate transferase
LTPILALAVPIADALLAILRRGFWSPVDGASRPNISERLLAIFRRDREHIHHRLMSKGLKESHAVLMLYGASLLSAAIAIVTFQSAVARVIALALMLGAGVFVGVRKLR